MAQLAGRIVAVTGGGRGIGRAIAEAFADEGAMVVVGARTPAFGEEAIAAITAAGGTASLRIGDISVQADCDTLIAAAVDRYGGLDILVHAAADIPNGGIDASDEAIRRGFDSIVMAAFWLTRAARPHLAKSGSGRIVMIGSVCGPTTMVAGRMACGVCKYGLDAFMRGAALELADHGITINAIQPGFIASARPVANECGGSQGDRRTLPRGPSGHVGGNRPRHAVPRFAQIGLHHRQQHRDRWRRHDHQQRYANRPGR